MEPIEQKPKRKRQINPDRIVLESESLSFINSIGAQIAEIFSGMVKLTNREIVNFILQTRAELLTRKELRQLKNKYIDEERAAKLALEKVKAGKERGETISFAEAYKQINTPFIGEKLPPKIPKKKREKKLDASNESTMPSTNSTNVNA